MNKSIEADSKLPVGQVGACEGANHRPALRWVNSIIQALKYVWAFPVTFFGLIAVGLTAITGGSVRVVTGVIEASGGFASWLICHGLRRRVSAMTAGHVIIGLDQEYLRAARPHEQVHVWQYERWGLLFIPLYAASSIIAWSQGRHYYRDNVFEREAYAISDGKPQA